MCSPRTFQYQVKGWKIMKKNIRCFSAILTLLLLLGAFAGCFTPGSSGTNTSENPDQAATEPPVTEPPVVPAHDIYIAEAGEVKFKIVYADNLASDVKESAVALYEAIKKRSNDGVVVMSEAIPSAYDAEATEILIGDTTYAESTAVMNGMGYGDWKICFEGNKLVVVGFSRDALRAAITRTIQQMKNGAQDDGSIILKSDLLLQGTQDSAANALPKYESAAKHLPNTADEGQGCSLIVANNSTVAEYEAYLAKLTVEGYSLYTTNTIGENRFDTYKNGTYLIHAGWYAYEKAARVTIEKTSNVVGLESENTYTPAAGITTSLAQFGLVDGVENGMIYCYQLADGSFLVIDSGYSNDADPLYNYMKAKAPNGKIVIAAWIITHNDGDHIKGFITFTSKYKNEVTVEKVIKNLPGSFTYLEGDTNENGATNSSALAYKDCTVIKAHTGMKIYLRNAVVEILYSIDGFLPKPMPIFNNTSLVFTVTVEGERALFLGDVSDDVAGILNAMYGSFLKSDMVQLAHHGLRNGYGLNMPNTNELYKLIRAEVVLWPTSESHYNNVDNEAEDQQVALHSWNIEAMKSARETWLAGNNRILVFELPYAYFSAYQFDPANPHPTPVAKDQPSVEDRLDYIVSVGGSDIEHVDWNQG
ncbi:MAG: MBL fold metallo-hydrolase [Ruminococcaceae bacterium]|nr:MBL fold metallo-hydrolase [Oscillospiraceae bacterium]